MLNYQRVHVFFCYDCVCIPENHMANMLLNVVIIHNEPTGTVYNSWVIGIFRDMYVYIDVCTKYIEIQHSVT